VPVIQPVPSLRKPSNTKTKPVRICSLRLSSQLQGLGWAGKQTEHSLFFSPLHFLCAQSKNAMVSKLLEMSIARVKPRHCGGINHYPVSGYTVIFSNLKNILKPSG
jgi:hypothetical protein